LPSLVKQAQSICAFCGDFNIDLVPWR